MSGSREVLKFPSLTILHNDKYKNFPEDQAIKWARNLMISDDNAYYDGFFMDYYYPCYDDDGNDVDRYKVRLFGTIPGYFESEGIDEITL